MHDVECVHKQKSDKAPGLDGIPTEADAHGWLYQSFCTLAFVVQYLLEGWLFANGLYMQAVIIPLVKCKTGRLTVTMTEPLTISTALSNFLSL